MGWKRVSLFFFIAAIICIPVWPYSLRWSIYPTGFCFFLAVLTFLVSIFGRSGSLIWRDRGRG